MPVSTASLSNVEFFSELPPHSLKRIEKLSRVRSYSAGEAIVTEGEEGVGFFVIESGEARVTRGNIPLANLGPGESFGEMALLDHRRRSATVRAASDVTCVAIMRSDFVSELNSSPAIAVGLLTSMSRRLRAQDEATAGCAEWFSGLDD